MLYSPLTTLATPHLKAIFRSNGKWRTKYITHSSHINSKAKCAQATAFSIVSTSQEWIMPVLVLKFGPAFNAALLSKAPSS